MTDEDDALPWTPPMFKGMQEMSEQAIERQHLLHHLLPACPAWT